MNKPKFTIALIARNEAKTLPRLLNSLSEFKERGGEVLLLDTGSTDNTAQIARDMGCEVQEVGNIFKIEISEERANAINEKFVAAGDTPIVKAGDSMFDYSSARNYIAGFSKTPMIAMPDCDEIYTKLDLDEIDRAIQSGVDQFEYNFVYSHDEQGNEAIKFMHSKFYNKDKMTWVGIIHEVLQANSEISRTFFPETVIKLEHYQNVETNRGHYLTGLAYDCFNDPSNDRNAHYLGRELFYTHRYNSAIKQLKIHVEMKRWPAEASQSLMFIGDSYLVLGEDKDALNAYREAFDLCPTRREPLMKMAEFYYKRKMVDQTIAYTAAALQIKQGEGHFYANFQPYYENIPHEMMYWALWEKGEIAASKDHFDMCYLYQPFYSKYMHDFRFYYKLPKISFVIPTIGRPEGLKKVIESIKGLNFPQENLDIIVVSDGEPMEWNGDTQITLINNPERIGVPKSLKKGVEASKGDWVVYASNDIEFTQDSLMAAFKTAMDNNKWFMSFNTDIERHDQGTVCEHFMIHKKLIPKLGGEIFDTEFNHVGVDNLLWAKLKKINQAMRCERAVVIHKHFSKDETLMDSVYQLGWNADSVAKDRELLAIKLKNL